MESLTPTIFNLNFKIINFQIFHTYKNNNNKILSNYNLLKKNIKIFTFANLSQITSASYVTSSGGRKHF